MGIWHKPFQVALILKKIQLDINPRLLYEYEYNLGWTDSSTFGSWWKNTRERIEKLTGNDVYYYFKKDTINYRKFIESKNCYLYFMSRKKSKELTKEERRELLRKLDKEDLLIINEAYEEVIKELQEEIAKQKKIKSKCLIGIKIEAKYKKYNKRFNKTLICKILNLSRRTFNDKLRKQNILAERKIRKDAISSSPLACSLVWQSFEDSNGTYGQKRVHQDILNKGFKYSLSVISTIMRKTKLYANEVKVKHRKYEDKNTNINLNYLVRKENLINYKPNEVYSIDFSQIETSRGKAWLHGARDIITGKIEFLKLCWDQKIETVLSHYRLLPSSTKIINTDHGSSYLSYEVQSYLRKRGIKQSLGNAGCSYHNRWIEDFWKRIKYEWFTIYPTNNITPDEIEKNIERYVNFFNNKRLSMFTGSWNIPTEVDISYKINSGQFI